MKITNEEFKMVLMAIINTFSNREEELVFDTHVGYNWDAKDDNSKILFLNSKQITLSKEELTNEGLKEEEIPTEEEVERIYYKILTKRFELTNVNDWEDRNPTIYRLDCPGWVSQR